MRPTSEWQIRCPVCGRTRALKDLGVTREGAAGRPRIFGRCSQCGKFRSLIVEPIPREEQPAEVVPSAAPTARGDEPTPAEEIR